MIFFAQVVQTNALAETANTMRVGKGLDGELRPIHTFHTGLQQIRTCTLTRTRSVATLRRSAF